MDETMTNLPSHKVHLSPLDFDRLRELRTQKPARNIPRQVMTRGAALADWVAETVGSWRFIIIQSVLLGIWITLNVMAFIKHWDPYPFILLNLVLSFQAAYAAPIIMMSQNRQSEIDRRHAEHDYRINVKAGNRIASQQDRRLAGARNRATSQYHSAPVCTSCAGADRGNRSGGSAAWLGLPRPGLRSLPVRRDSWITA
jgi:uncharacterized membrane protein